MAKLPVSFDPLVGGGNAGDAGEGDDAQPVAAAGVFEIIGEGGLGLEVLGGDGGRSIGENLDRKSVV